jgi:hypothetical protein
LRYFQEKEEVKDKIMGFQKDEDFQSTIFKMFFSKIVGLAIFGVILIIGNIIRLFSDNSILNSFFGFLNGFSYLILIFTVLLFLGQLFWLFDFPVNLPGPIIEGLSGVVLVKFFFHALIYASGFMKDKTNMIPFDNFYKIAGIVIFILILILGYSKLFYILYTGKSERKLIKP